MAKSLFAWCVLFPGAAVAQQGAWEEPPFRFGNDPAGSDAIQPVHLIHVYTGTTGKVVAITAAFATAPCWSDLTRLWTPPAATDPPGWPGSFQDIPLCRTQVFCGGHSALADGRILTVGGNFLNHIQADLFDPTKPLSPPGNPWNNPSAPADMSFPRFYPTATTLPDGRVLISSGRIEFPPTAPPPSGWATTPEIYTPSSNGFTPVPSANRWQMYYPFMFVLPDGNLVDAGPDVLWNTGILVTSNWTWGPPIPEPTWPIDPPPPPPQRHGSAAMYEPGKIMVCGGSDDEDPAVRTTFKVDLNNANPLAPPAWLAAGNMHRARRNHNLVILPDGKVLAVGGNEVGTYGNPVFGAEIFDPASGAWTLEPGSHLQHPRWYHSTAMLLRDGRVVSAGGDASETAQIYRPPYLTGDPPPPRPTIMGAPTVMQYGQSYPIMYVRNGGPVVTRACLIRLASVTHGFDQDQRRVPLTILESGPVSVPLYQVTVQAPANGNIAPPGYYMLFILNEYEMNKFTPCELAAYVRVGT